MILKQKILIHQKVIKDFQNCNSLSGWKTVVEERLVWKKKNNPTNKNIPQKYLNEVFFNIFKLLPSLHRTRMVGCFLFCDIK